MLRSFFACEEGQGLVEYALIIALVSIALLVALGAMSGMLGRVYGTIQGRLDQVAS